MKYRFRCIKCGSESERDIPLDEYDRLKHEQVCGCGEKMERVIEWEGFARGSGGGWCGNSSGNAI